MKYLYKSVLLALIVLFATSAPLRAEKKVVATVDGQEITEKDMVRAETEMFNQLVNVPKKARRKVLVEYLIETQILAKAAQDAKVGETDEFKNSKDYYHRRALRDTYFDQQVFKAVSDKDAQSTYDEAGKEEEAHVRHILVKEQKLANEIYEKLDKGGDFNALAKEHSIDPGSKDKGGDLGYILKTQVVPQFGAVAFGMSKKGETAKPVQSQFGWHIIRMEEKRPRSLPPFKDVKDRIKEVLWQKKAQELIENLRKSAKVEFVDKELAKPLPNPRGSN